MLMVGMYGRSFGVLVRKGKRCVVAEQNGAVKRTCRIGAYDR